jgi:hypothetical protein
MGRRWLSECEWTNQTTNVHNCGDGLKDQFEREMTGHQPLQLRRANSKRIE